MATLLYSPSPNKLSPLPKRSRLSLKQSKPQLSPSECFLSKQELSDDSSCKDKDGVQTDSCTVQDENASPNCKTVLSNQSPLINSDVLENQIHETYALGLPNCGNTCYVNSILQVLRYTPNFLSSVHGVLYQIQLAQNSFNSGEVKEIEFFYRLHKLYMTITKQEAALYKNVEVDSLLLLHPLESFLLCLREVSFLFEEGEQHDAHEFLLTIISIFNTFCDIVRDKVPTSSDSSVVSDTQASIHINRLNPHSPPQDKQKNRLKNRLKRKQKSCNKLGRLHILPFNSQNVCDFDLGFEGKMRHTIKCLECEKKSETTDMFTNLEVSIADDLIIEGTVDLRQCLEQRTILSEDNKYFCDECFHKNEALSSYDIILPPSILLLHCSWLRQSSNITDVEKDTTKVLIPMFLKTSELTDIFCCEPDQIYSLYAVVLHIGTSTEVGHYVSFIKDASKSSEIADIVSTQQNYVNVNCCVTEEILNFKFLSSSVNRWLLFDDENVSTVDVDETSETFPYFKYLGITASPCMIFYCKM